MPAFDSLSRVIGVLTAILGTYSAAVYWRAGLSLSHYDAKQMAVEMHANNVTAIYRMAQLGEDLSEQVARLATFIMENVPGEPSASEGAIECAIRIIKGQQIVIERQREELVYLHGST